MPAYHWNGSAWVESIPRTHDGVEWTDDNDSFWAFNGSEWELIYPDPASSGLLLPVENLAVSAGPTDNSVTIAWDLPEQPTIQPTHVAIRFPDVSEVWMSFPLPVVWGPEPGVDAPTPGDLNNPGPPAPGAEPPAIPTDGIVRIGAAIDLDATYSATTYPAATTAFETLIGASIDIARRFDSGMPTAWDADAGNDANCFIQDEGVRDRIISVKGSTTSGPTQAQHVTFMNDIPVDGFKTYYICHHEPENDVKQGKPTHTAAWFQDKLDDLHAAWVTAGSRDDIIPSLCLTSYWERDDSSSTSSANWFPRSAIIEDFCLFLDPYDEASSGTSMEDKVYRTLQLWAAAGGGPWGIAEAGTKKTGTAGATWIHEACQYVRQNNGVAFCYFHSSVGPTGPWWLDDPIMQAQLGAEVGVVGGAP
jgi:hypothetical protein